MVLAMAEFQLGHAQKASALLDKASPIVDSLPKPGDAAFDTNFPDWIVCQSLLREAKALIDGHPATRPATRPSP